MRVFAIGTRDEQGASGTTETAGFWSSLLGDWHPPETVDGIPVRRMKEYEGNKKARYFLYGWNVARFCANAAPDVLHTLAANPWNAAALYHIRRQGIPIIYTQTMVPDLRDDAARQWLHNLAYAPVSCIVVSSSVMQSTLEDAGVDSRIEIIPNGVDVQRFRPVTSAGEKEELRKSLQLPVEGTIVLFVGGALVPRKGVDVLAEGWVALAAQRPKLNLVLLGKEKHPRYAEEPRYKEFHRNLKQTLSDFAEEGRVHYPGMVDNVEDYMRASDLFVFPSKKEGMPNVVGEAFACGLPSVLTPFEGLPEEFGRPGREYRLVERTSRALREAMAEFIDSGQLRERFAERARKWVEDELDVERSLDAYARLYRELSL